MRRRSWEEPRSATLASAGGEASAQSWLRATPLHGRCCACSTWAWARGGPASLGRRCRHARVRRRGGGRLASRSSLPMVFDSPMMREMSLLRGDRAPLCSGATRRPRRSAWRPGKVVGNSGERGGESHLLVGHCPFSVRPLLVSFGFLCLERDPRVSPTINCHLAQENNSCRAMRGALSAPYAAALRMVALRGGS